MSLPRFISANAAKKTDDATVTALQDSFNRLQTTWPNLINPIIDSDINKGVILKNIVLSSSAVISHTLGRTLTGWHIVRQRGSATVYDIQDINTTPEKTLLLNATSGVTVDLWVF